MRRCRNSSLIQACEVLELRTYPSSMWSSIDGLLTIMCPSPTSVVHMTQYDYQTVVQVDAEAPVIFASDAVRYLAAFAPDGEYLASVEIVVLPAVAGDVSLAQSRTQADDDFTLCWSQNPDGLSDDDSFIVLVEADLPIVDENDEDLVSGFSADYLSVDVIDDTSVDSALTTEEEVSSETFEVAVLPEEVVDESFDTVLVEIFSSQEDLLVDANL